MIDAEILAAKRRKNAAHGASRGKTLQRISPSGPKEPPHAHVFARRSLTEFLSTLFKLIRWNPEHITADMELSP
jgi:hypothetical protein